jgi:1-acyl-sn-glycerol-3-phosphate acyltransferase
MKQPNTSSLPKASLGVVVRSAIFYLGQVLSTFAIGPLVLLAGKQPWETRYAIAQIWVRFNLWMLKNICGMSHEVHGLENIPAQNGVILSKHQSAWEAFHFQAIFPPLAFLLKQELLRIPLWGWAMAKLEPIAIDRGAKTAALKKVLRDGEDRLKAGRWVVIFPEGTRVPPGQRGQYNSSGALLAHRAGCPVLPVAHNAGEFWRRNAFLKFPGVIQVHIGPPIDPKQHSAAEVNKQAEEWIEARMAEISSVGPAPAGQA